MASYIGWVLLYSSYIRDFLKSQLFSIIGKLLPTLHVDDIDLTGKLVIVTGANSGIGFSLAESFARANATVYLACRNVQKGQEAAAKIIDSLADGSGSSKRIHVVQLDTSSLKSVRAFADSWAEGGRASGGKARKIDIIMHNAGIAGNPSGTNEITDEGLESLYATNFLGSYLLTSLLEQYLASDARVVLTSSVGQYNGDLTSMFTLPRMISGASAKPRMDSEVYGDTKSMQVVFAKLLQERWVSQAAKDGNTRIAHSFSPGFTFTPIIGKLEELPRFDPLWWVLKTGQSVATPVEVGAATGLWLATTSDEKAAAPSNGGKYWDRLTEFTPSAALFEAKFGHGALLRIWDLWSVDSGATWA